MLRPILLVLLLMLSLPLPAELINRLGRHPSPYLAMHGDDPVAWQTWGGEALAAARADDRLLFISSGYFACHWCHVMQRESYKNPQVAALLNQNFVPVKVDRELQPALDAHLIDFVQRTKGNAGWPLNVFLTPEGYPLVGLTYAPPESFVKLLVRLRKLWRERAGELREAARSAAAAMVPDQPAPAAAPIDARALHTGLVTMALSFGDEMEGGFGGQSRFPMAPQWSVLLDRLGVEPDQRLGELIELTLDQMAGNGLRDHIGGGFFRYTVDPGWQLPHYEKMLYTQALLARLYIKAAKVLARPDYLEVARETLDFTLTELQGTDGGFIASLSAVDPENVEGGGYLWTQPLLAAALADDELAFARHRWRLQGSTVTGAGWLPVDGADVVELARRYNTGVDRQKAMERRVKQKLLSARSARKHPRDNKQLAAWNGLMLSALVDGARVLNGQRYREAARRLRNFLVDKSWDGKRLLRARGPEGDLGSAALEDYVYVAAGLHDWAELTGSDRDLAFTGRLVEEAWRRFFQHDGWQITDNLMIPGMAREKAISDGPLPSPAAMLIELTLGKDDPKLQSQVRQALQNGYGPATAQPVRYATQVAASIRALGLERVKSD
ncbi:MAG: thioredoxin domain-containing protein [Gammaproteobacteria bacterium]|nr:thioredoxin domain-containing protein [Gammaproteobacteria bacterium]